MTAWFIVRAEVDPSIKAEFDTWYRDEHLPDALKAFQAISANRGWSSIDTNVHLAFYEFTDLNAANAAVNSEAMKELIAEFDRCFPDNVTRTREMVEFSQAI